MAWLIALIAYIAYAVLAVATTSAATKVWVASAFAVVSIGVWLLLHHLDRNGRR